MRNRASSSRRYREVEANIRGSIAPLWPTLAPYTEPVKTRPFNPLRLDVEPFARERGHLEGAWPLESLDRVQSLPADMPRVVSWLADGEHRPVAGGDDELWLRLRADTTVTLPCQRCLGPVDLRLEFDRAFRFARDEAAAEALDAELEDDVLALTRTLDLRALVEDELLLELPLVPRHVECPGGGLPLAAEDDGAVPASPFAALAALKKRLPPG
jgi:uncharacterized protein